MQLKAIIILASGLSAVTAWTIPEGTSDGVYEVHTDASGIEIHTPLSAPAKRAFAIRGTNTERSIAKRTLQGTNEVGCRDYGLLSVDTDNAVGALKSQCQGGPTGGGEASGTKDIYSVFGNTVAYFCNNSINNNHCYADEVEDALQNHITGQCGSYVGGYDVVEDRALEYGYANLGEKFCGRGR